jgi:DNA transformation protein
VASKQSTVDYILEQVERAGPVSSRRMCGEFCIYCGGKPVAFVCDDQLFVKPTGAGTAYIARTGQVVEGFPYPGAKPYLLIGGDRWDDHQWMAGLVRTTADALPAPAPKKPRAATATKKVAAGKAAAKKSTVKKAPAKKAPAKKAPAKESR